MAEGFFLAHALAALDRLGVLVSLERPAEARILAERHGIDAAILGASLELLCARTDLIVQRRGRYRLSRRYDDYARFVLHQYLGAYHGNATGLKDILRYPALAKRAVDPALYALAFTHTTSLSVRWLADLVLQLGLNHVLDLGCGTGAMLVDLASRRADFIGWGLDISPWMCRAARQAVANSVGRGRIRILRGDSRRVKDVVPSAVVARVKAVTASSLANEFFADGPTGASGWLTGIKKQFPGRPLLIADYYSRLWEKRKPRLREIALHDFVQAISGQGVPPAKLADWRAIYAAAHVDLVHVIEDRGLAFFIHVLKL